MVRIASSIQVVHIFSHLAHILTLIHDFLHLHVSVMEKGWS